MRQKDGCLKVATGTTARGLLAPAVLLALAYPASAGLPVASAGGPNERACCFCDGDCEMLRPQQCVLNGGVPQGAHATCDNTQCFDPVSGACCLPDGTCQQTSVQECLEAGGAPLPNLTCDQAHCGGVPEGACCFPGGDCAVLEPMECVQQGGFPRPNHGCDDMQCPQIPVVACCLADANAIECAELPITQCLMEGGQPGPPNSTCGNTACPFTSACCLPDGSCEELGPQACIEAGGLPRGNQPCGEFDCPQFPPVACCLETPAGSTCHDVPVLECLMEGGQPGGKGSSCEGTDCGDPQTGACCFADAPCEELPPAECIELGGLPLANQTCDGGCPHVDVVACCIEEFGMDICIDETIINCLKQGGQPGPPGSTCNSTGCPGQQEAACCLPDATCSEIPPQACLANGGQPHPNSTCDQVDCTIVETVACCLGAEVCVDVTIAECLMAGGVPGPNGSGCNVTGCPDPRTAACCLPFPLGGCTEIPPQECVAAGGEAHAGQACEQVDCSNDDIVACCFEPGDPAGCQNLSVDECIDSGGLPGPPNSTCDATVCPDTTLACCFADGACEQLPVLVCLDNGGMPRPGETCDTVHCNDVPAPNCCLPDGTCALLTPTDCAQQGGEPLPPGTPCGPNTCAGGGNAAEYSNQRSLGARSQPQSHAKQE